MRNEKLQGVLDFIVRRGKIIFPVIVIVVVALTVALALNAGDPQEDRRIVEEIGNTPLEAEETSEENANTEVALVLSDDPAVSELIRTYYDAMAEGDEEKLRGLCDEIPEKDMLRYMETAKYTSTYPVLEIYVKPGAEEGSVIAYVYYKVTFENQEAQFPGYQAHYICTDDQGNLYIKRSENTQEVDDYIIRVSSQDDVIEFNNRIQVEYNELVTQKPELLNYLSELDSQVSTAVGERLAQLAAQEQEVPQEEQPPVVEVTPAEDIVLYATATTTVNVRNSDSEQAEKLGKLTGGGKIQVLEQRVNGWTKVLYDNKEGYVKSEFLQLVESAAGAEVIGTVTATTNVNARVSPSESAERLGVITGGDSLELLAKENGWCKIIYAGQIAYVKAEFMQ